MAAHAEMAIGIARRSQMRPDGSVCVAESPLRTTCGAVIGLRQKPVQKIKCLRLRARTRSIDKPRPCIVRRCGPASTTRATRPPLSSSRMIYVSVRDVEAREAARPTRNRRQDCANACRSLSERTSCRLIRAIAAGRRTARLLSRSLRRAGASRPRRLPQRLFHDPAQPRRKGRRVLDARRLPGAGPRRARARPRPRSAACPAVAETAGER